MLLLLIAGGMPQSATSATEYGCCAQLTDLLDVVGKLLKLATPRTQAGGSASLTRRLIAQSRWLTSVLLRPRASDRSMVDSVQPKGEQLAVSQMPLFGNHWKRSICLRRSPRRSFRDGPRHFIFDDGRVIWIWFGSSSSGKPQSLIEALRSPVEGYRDLSPVICQKRGIRLAAITYAAYLFPPIW